MLHHGTLFIHVSHWYESREKTSLIHLCMHSLAILGGQSVIVEQGAHQEKPLWMNLLSPVDEYRRHSALQWAWFWGWEHWLQEIKLEIQGHSYLRQFLFNGELRAATYLHVFYSRKASFGIFFLEPLKTRPSIQFKRQHNLFLKQECPQCH